MPQSLRIVFYMASRDPFAILGLLLIGAFAVLFIHIQFAMKSIGYKTYPLFAISKDWSLPSKYLKVRSKQGWSPWPVYLLWPCLGVGIIALVFGLFRL